MKYLAIFLLSFAVFPFALAAKSVNGTVPVLRPLQPAPEGVFLDYENPLNSPPADSQSAEGIDGSGGTKQAALEAAPVKGPRSSTAAAVKNIFSSNVFNYGLIVFGFLILCWGAYNFFRDKE